MKKAGRPNKMYNKVVEKKKFPTLEWTTAGPFLVTNIPITQNLTVASTSQFIVTSLSGNRSETS